MGQYSEWTYYSKENEEFQHLRFVVDRRGGGVGGGGGLRRRVYIGHNRVSSSSVTIQKETNKRYLATVLFIVVHFICLA